MKDDLKNLTKLALDIADVIGDITKNYRLGFGSFVDKPVAPFIQIDTKERPCATCVPTFGFKHNFRFSKDAESFKRAIEDQKTSINLDSPEGGFDALMQATVCKDAIGWQDVDSARRLI